MAVERSRLSACILMAPQWDLERCLRTWREAGLGAISLGVGPLEATGVDTAVDLVRASDLNVSSLMGINLLDVTDPDGFGVRLAQATEWLDVARALDVDCVYACCGPRTGLEFEEAVNRLVTQIQGVVPHLRQRGLRLALEPTHPLRQDLSFLNTATDVESLLDRVGDPSVGYVFDFWHLWWQRGVSEAARRSAPRVFSVQVSDHKAVTLQTPDRALPGGGVIPIAALVEALESGGYRGYYDFEVLGPDNEARGYERTLRDSISGFHRAVGGYV